MGDLRPLGSEKLQGKDKLNRILEISRFKENIPRSINETSKDEYKIHLADGKEYQIVKEKQGYIIKKTINESTTDYIEPIRSRKYYSSYSQALKRLNLMAKEMNSLHDNKEGISLFEQKKFVLKTPKPAAPPPPEDEVENVPPPPAGDAAPPPPPAGDAVPPPPAGDAAGTPPPPSEDMGDTGDMGGEDMGGEDMGGEDMGGEDMGDMGGGDEVVTFKTIQKLTGRLGQKLRTLNSDEENQMSSKDIKYVINSILSALDLNNLDEDDREQIINKFEGIEGEDMGDTGDMGGEDMGDTGDMGGEDMGDTGDMEGSEEVPTEPQEMEFNETWSDLASNLTTKNVTHGITPGQFDEMDDESSLGFISDEVFVENKIENILANYFIVTENEKKFNKSIKKERNHQTITKTKTINSEIKRLSESVLQEVSARKLIKESPKLKFVGKTNKNNLIFENSDLKQIKITPNGDII